MAFIHVCMWEYSVVAHTHAHTCTRGWRRVCDYVLSGRMCNACCVSRCGEDKFICVSISVCVSLYVCICVWRFMFAQYNQHSAHGLNCGNISLMWAGSLNEHYTHLFHSLFQHPNFRVSIQAPNNSFYVFSPPLPSRWLPSLRGCVRREICFLFLIQDDNNKGPKVHMIVERLYNRNMLSPTAHPLVNKGWTRGWARTDTVYIQNSCRR